MAQYERLDAARLHSRPQAFCKDSQIQRFFLQGFKNKALAVLWDFKHLQAPPTHFALRQIFAARTAPASVDRPSEGAFRRNEIAIIMNRKVARILNIEKRNAPQNLADLAARRSRAGWRAVTVVTVVTRLR